MNKLAHDLRFRAREKNSEVLKKDTKCFRQIVIEQGTKLTQNKGEALTGLPEPRKPQTIKISSGSNAISTKIYVEIIQFNE